MGEFKNKFDLECSFREYNKVCKAIPLPLLNLIQNHLYYSEGQIILPMLQLNQIPINDKKCVNKVVCKMFKSISFNDFNKDIKIRGCNIRMTSKYIKFFKWPIPPKVKEMQFKILNGYYPAAAMLKK